MGAGTTFIEKVVEWLMEPDPLPKIANVTLSFEDFATQNPCNVQTSGLTPCVRKCEQRCKATFKFDDPNCENGLSTVIWHGTCRENFKNGKLRKKFPMKGCTDYEVYWGTHPLPGWAYDRGLTLKKKGKNKVNGEGDQCGFTVTGCHRQDEAALKVMVTEYQ
ncbi:hypothetical protein FIE12Z_6862 [Fusarium flagelliforme]|uniref:Uncharacterized protein n=1 Tax=Fusarium flagelliforme TaxID=2675880 RepID=A0A395MM05_9HYPO|nr:hypothetical protein FIE12Z_6862 [Fusarium flagelliforme]